MPKLAQLNVEFCGATAAISQNLKPIQSGFSVNFGDRQPQYSPQKEWRSACINHAAFNFSVAHVGLQILNY
jgi:hypothetical protein